MQTLHVGSCFPSLFMYVIKIKINIEQHKNNAEYQRCVYRHALALDPWVKWGLFRVETGNVIELFFLHYLE